MTFLLNNYWKIILFIFIFIFFSIPTLDHFFRSDIYPCDDGKFHLVKMGAFNLSINQGHFIPRWGNFMGNGYGLPVLLLSYPAPYYFQLPFRYLGFSLVESYKLVTAFSMIIGSFVLYFLFRKKNGGFHAFIAVCLIIYSPIWIANIFGRCALGENTAFLGLSLLLFNLDSFGRNPNIRNFSIMSILWAVLILSQPMFVFIYFPLFLFYYLFLFFNSKRLKTLLIFFFSLLTGVSLSMFSLLPILYELRYTHYNYSGWDGSILINKYLKFWNLFIPDKDLFFSTVSRGYPLFFGYAQLIVLLIGSCLFIRMKSGKNRSYLLAGIVIFIFSLLFNIQNLFFLYKLFPYLPAIQFPWRFLGLASFGIGIMYLGMTDFMGKRNRLIPAGLFLILILSFFITIERRNAVKVGGTEDCLTDECLIYEQKNDPDYGLISLPIWSKETKFYKKIDKKLEVLDGDGTIREKTIRDTKLKYDINMTRNSLLLFNSLYFPGWQARIDGQPLEIQFQNPDYPGLILVNVPSGKHEIEFSFTRTKIRQIADSVSLIILILLILLVVFQTKIKDISQKNA